MSNKCVNIFIDLLIPSEGSLRGICYKIFLVKYHSTILLLLLAALICQSASHFFSFIQVIFFYSGLCHPGCYQPPHDDRTDGLWLNLLTYWFSNSLLFSFISHFRIFISYKCPTPRITNTSTFSHHLLPFHLASSTTLILTVPKLSQVISSLLSLFPNST